jgi:hypothetical protein
MGSFFDELMYRDPQHHALAFCLVWWIPLLLTPLACWVISLAWGRLSVRGRWMVAVELLCPILPAAMQLASDWYLAGYWASLIVYPLAVACYTCIVFMLWLCFKAWLIRGFVVLLLAPVGLVAYLSFTSFILLMGMFAFPHASGRLTPNVTWRTDWTSMSFTSDWVAYDVYTNSRWFPLIKHQVVEGRCFTDAVVDGNPAFRVEGTAAVVSCRQSDGEIVDNVIAIR